MAFKKLFSQLTVCEMLMSFNRNVSYKMKSKHWNPRFRYARAKKYLKVDLIDTDNIYQRERLTPEEIRSEMKKEGIMAHRSYNEKMITLTSTSGVIDPYIPPEDDGISSKVKDRVIDKSKEFLLKGRSMLDAQKIKRIDPTFKIKNFPTLANNIYIAAHKALVDFDNKALHDLVTEKAFVEMTYGLEYCTIAWELIESIEPPRVVHARAFNQKAIKQSIGDAPAEFGQITVRFHTRQRLSIYDRFGRLMYGNKPPLHIQPASLTENLKELAVFGKCTEDEKAIANTALYSNSSTPRDVLEYVVFENHLIDSYGKWRIHAKVIPSWLTKINLEGQQVIRTFNSNILPNHMPNSSSSNSDDKTLSTVPEISEVNIKSQNEGISRIIKTESVLTTEPEINSESNIKSQNEGISRIIKTDISNEIKK